MKSKPDNKIEDILNSLDGVSRAPANDFLLAKIRNRMQQHAQPFLPAQWGWRLALVLLAIVLLNAFTIQYLRTDRSPAGVQAVATEYSISIPDSY